MGLWNRTRSIVRRAAGYFTGRTPDPQGLLHGVWPVGRGEPPDLSTRNLLEGYETMPWVRAIAGRIATAMAETEWQLFAQMGPAGKAIRNKALQRAKLQRRREWFLELSQKKEIVPILDHPMLDALTTSSTPMTVAFDTLRLAQLGLDLVGDAFLVKERNVLGTVVGLWSVPSHWVIGLPTPTLPFFYVSWNAWVGNIPDTEILWIHDPAPVNPWGRGSGVARALGDELETDEYSAKHAKQLFFNRARPDFVVMLEGAEKPEVKRAEMDWNARNQGFWRQAKPYFVNRKLDFHEFANPTLENLTLVPLRTFERDIIMQTWGIPPEILGILENANRSTIEAADFFLEKHVIQPRREFMRSALQARLAPEYDDRLILDYVSTVGRDKEYELSVMKSAPWAFTADDWRRRAGYEELPAEAGKVHLVPLNSFTTEDLGDQESRPDPHPAAGLPGGGGDEKPAPPPPPKPKPRKAA